MCLQEQATCNVSAGLALAEERVMSAASGELVISNSITGNVLALVIHFVPMWSYYMSLADSTLCSLDLPKCKSIIARMALSKIALDTATVSHRFSPLAPYCSGAPTGANASFSASPAILELTSISVSLHDSPPGMARSSTPR